MKRRNARSSRLTLARLLPLLAAAVLAFPPAVRAQETRYDVPPGRSPAIGPPDAPVTVVEFVDYQ